MTIERDFKMVVPVGQMTGEDDEETEQLRVMLQEARAYLLSFQWCLGISREFFGLGIGGVACVFLFELKAPSGVDNVLWVVVGDLPSAYLVADQADNPCAALRVYCGLMEEWVLAVRLGRSLSGVFPVTAPATEQNARLLEKKIAFLRNEVLPAFSSSGGSKTMNSSLE